MLDFEDGADALTGRKRIGIADAVVRLLGIVALGLLLVLTIAVLL